VTKIAVGIIQLWFHYFRGILACTCPREAKQRDALVVGLFTPVSLFVYEDDQFANLSVPFKNAMPFDTHESAKPSSVLAGPRQGGRTMSRSGTFGEKKE